MPKVFKKNADIYIKDSKWVDTSPRPSPQGEGGNKETPRSHFKERTGTRNPPRTSPQREDGILKKGTIKERKNGISLLKH